MDKLTSSEALNILDNINAEFYNSDDKEVIHTRAIDLHRLGIAFDGIPAKRQSYSQDADILAEREDLSDLT